VVEVIKAGAPLECPGSRFKAFQPSTLTSSEPHTLPFAVLKDSTKRSISLNLAEN
jgi:hypothetical protein